MRRNESLLHLARIMNKCNELELPGQTAIRHCGECIDEMADDIMASVQKLLDKPDIRSCRISLVIDFEHMTHSDYWLSSKIFKELPRENSLALQEKLMQMTNMLRALQIKKMKVDPVYAEKFFQRMSERCKKKKYIFDYEIWKIAHPDYTLGMLLDKEVDMTAELLMKEVLAYDDMPTAEELEAVRLDFVQKHRKCNATLPEGFEKECAKIRRYSHWEGQYLFMIDYPRIYRYLYMNCFEQFTKKQRWAIYEYDMQLKMIHEDIQRLMGEQHKHLPEVAAPTSDYMMQHLNTPIRKEAEISKEILRQKIAKLFDDGILNPTKPSELFFLLLAMWARRLMESKEITAFVSIVGEAYPRLFSGKLTKEKVIESLHYMNNKATAYFDLMVKDQYSMTTYIDMMYPKKMNGERRKEAEYAVNLANKIFLAMK